MPNSSYLSEETSRRKMKGTTVCIHIRKDSISKNNRSALRGPHDEMHR